MLSSLTAVAEDPSTLNPSPKRKRPDSADPATTAALSSFTPRLNLTASTIAQNASLPFESPSPSGSPRSIIAARLSDLQIQELKNGLPALEFGATDKSNKRVKRTVAFKDVKSEATSRETAPGATLTYETMAGEQSNNGPATVVDGPDIINPTEPYRSLTPKSFSETRKTSSPPPSLSDLVWKDSEITGHTMADPDDDGTGINGIGFKPTPAIQYAREQRRRQQVHNWKIREAREARQKRSERRKGMAATKEKKAVEGTIRKIVRFADALKG